MGSAFEKNLRIADETGLPGNTGRQEFKIVRGYAEKLGLMNRVVRKPQVFASQARLCQIPLKTAKCYAFCETCQDFSPGKSNISAVKPYAGEMVLEMNGRGNIVNCL
jgi:hypothetical protein